MKASRKNFIYWTGFFLLGFFLAILVDGERDLNPMNLIADDSNSRSAGGGKFTNPLLDCADLSDLTNKKVYSLKDKARSFIEDKESNKLVTDISVYFRDLNNGPWFGIGEKKDFSPASLLKVPLMMAVYKQAMLQPGFINKVVEVKEDGFDSIETIKSNNFLKKGDKKTVGEVVEYMIKYSDNNASYLLSHEVDRKIYTDTYQELGIAVPENPEYTISVRTYSSFFRILYNSTYLTQEYSEKALKLLSESEFKDGLLAGVPGNVVVSHKFGERDLGDGMQQIHDCGIIYDKDYPYLLCIMTRGRRIEDLVKTISEISQMVYTDLNKQ